MIPTDSSSNNQMIVLSINPSLEGLKKKAFDIITDSSSNNQMIVLPIIPNLGDLKKNQAEMTHQNWPKRPRAETTGPKRPRAVAIRNHYEHHSMNGFAFVGYPSLDCESISGYSLDLSNQGCSILLNQNFLFNEWNDTD